MGRDPRVRQLDTVRVLRHLGLRGQIHPDDACVFAFPDLETFEASAERDRREYGNRVLGPFETEAGIVGVVDMGPQLVAKGGRVTPAVWPDDRHSWD